MNSYPMPKQTTSGETKKDVFNLSDRGQAALINAWKGQGKGQKDSFAQLLEAISKPIIKKKTSNTVDLTKFSRMIVFSVTNNTEETVNRIEQLKLTLTLDDPDKIRYSNWDKMVTNYKTVDIGKLTLGKSRSFTLSPSYSTSLSLPSKWAGASSGQGGAITVERSLEEESNVRERGFINGILSDSEMIISQKGLPGEDLNGNLVVELELETVQRYPKNYYTFSPPSAGDKEKLKNNIPTLGIVSVWTPNLDKPIIGKLCYEYVYRYVQKGQETGFEWDDEVVYRKGKCGKSMEIVLIPQQEFEVKGWSVNSADKEVVHIGYRQKTPSALSFLDDENAYDFISWLKEQKKTNNLKIDIMKNGKISRQIVDFTYSRGRKISSKDINTLKAEFEN